MDTYGYKWISMDIHIGRRHTCHGYPWISMDIHVYPWTSMDTPWTLEKNVHGHGWISIVDIHGNAFPSLYIDRLRQAWFSTFSYPFVSIRIHVVHGKLLWTFLVETRFKSMDPGTSV